MYLGPLYFPTTIDMISPLQNIAFSRINVMDCLMCRWERFDLLTLVHVVDLNWSPDSSCGCDPSEPKLTMGTRVLMMVHPNIYAWTWVMSLTKRSGQALANVGNPGSHIGPGLMPSNMYVWNSLCVMKRLQNYGPWMTLILPLLFNLLVYDDVVNMSQIQ
jgi:hypothetical protein